MSNYYNEHDPFAAAWLRELIVDKQIPDGVVDERDIQSVVPADLVGFTQCHFFAGVGGWSLALRLAGFPEDREIWTGSCPCQPFSVAGAGAGQADERHLWPEFFRIIAECRPIAVLGEQVEAAIRHGWLDLVQTDLESIDYACGAVVLPAAGVGAPHIRSRLWFVAERMADAECWTAERPRHEMGSAASSVQGEARQWQRIRVDAWGGCDAGVMANTMSARWTERWAGTGSGQATGGSGTVGVGDAERDGLQGSGRAASIITGEPGDGAVRGFWRDADCLVLPCRDGKSRPIPTEPALFPLADGVSNRVGILRGAGNAIVPEVAAEVIRAWQSC